MLDTELLSKLQICLAVFSQAKQQLLETYHPQRLSHSISREYVSDLRQVLIIGAGVAGLAAIAASKALGAVVRVFDTRPVVKEQVQSLGAEFLEIDLEEDAEVTLRHHHSAL